MTPPDPDDPQARTLSILRLRESLKNPACGTLIALCAAIAFAGMGFCVKMTAGSVPAAWVVFVRSSVGAILLTPFVLPQANTLRKGGTLTLWLRAVAGSISSFFYFWNLQRSSVGDAGVLLNLAPVMVALLSWVYLKERLRPLQISGIGLSLLGLSAVSVNADSRLSLPVFMSGLMGALLSAVAFTALRRAANRFSSRLVVWTYMIVGLMLTLAAGGPPLVGWLVTVASAGFMSPPFLWAVGSGICGLAGQLLFTLSFLSLEAAVATTLSLTSVLWGTLLEICFDGRRLGVWTWIEYAVVLTGAGILQWATLRNAKKGRPARLSGAAAAGG